MKAAAFEYRRVATAEEAVRALTQAGDGAKFIAGGQSLGPMLNLRLARPTLLVDVSEIDEDRTAGQGADRFWVRGGVTHAEVEDGELDAVLQRAPSLMEMMRHVARGIAYRAVRNRGTLAGSLAHADPAADWVLAMTALGAQLACRSENGLRYLSMSEFMLAAYTTALEENELVTGVLLPKYSDQMRWGYYKFCRKTGEFADASCACVFDPQERIARIVVGALDGAPVSLPTLAQQVALNAADGFSDSVIRKAVSSRIGDRGELENQWVVSAIKRSLKQVLGTQA